MSKINDGGPAFPGLVETGKLQIGDDEFAHPVFGAQGGMSLRDWFAGQALAGLCSSPSMRQIWDATDMAMQSYQFADAMLAERAKGGDE